VERGWHVPNHPEITVGDFSNERGMRAAQDDARILWAPRHNWAGREFRGGAAAATGNQPRLDL